MFRNVMQSDDEELEKTTKRAKMGDGSVNKDAATKLKVNKIPSGDPKSLSKESDCAYESGSED